MNWLHTISRKNQILAAALILQLALVAVVFWPRPASGARGAPLLAGLDVDQVVRVTIYDEQGAHIVLAKQTGSWVLPEAGDYPCTEDQVPGLLDKIAALKADRLVAQTEASHKRLQVGDQDYARLVELELADGSVRKLYLGSSPSYGATHVRAEGQEQVYLTSDLSTSDVSARAADWIDTLYVSVPQDQVVSLTLDNANGHFELTKGDDGQWTMTGLAPDETLSQNNVTSLVSRVASVRMLRPLGTQVQPDYGMDKPHAVVTITSRDEEGTTKTYALQVGTQSGEDNSYVLKSSESPYYVQVAEYTVQDWVEKTHDDLIELPPTPTPTS
jgi:hypothetical protein